MAVTTLQPASPSDKRGSLSLTLALRYVLLFVLAIIFLFPIVFMLVSSLKPNAQLLSDTGSLRAFLPIGDISLGNYLAVFKRVPMLRFVSNSVLVSALTVLGYDAAQFNGWLLAGMHALEWQGPGAGC